MTWGARDAGDDENTYAAKFYYAREGCFGRDIEALYTTTALYPDRIHFYNETYMHGVKTTYTDGSYYYGIALTDNITENFVILNRYRPEFTASSLLVGGYTLAPSTSDGRLKHDIKNTEIDALDRISKIQHRQFFWNKDEKEEKIGYIAQELEEIDENYVIKDEQVDDDGNTVDYLYQVNTLPILATATKAIAELKTIVENQSALIEKLCKKLDIEYIEPKTIQKENEENIVDYGSNIIKTNRAKLNQKTEGEELFIDKNGNAFIKTNQNKEE